MVNKYIIYVQIIPRRTPLRVKMSPPRAGTAVLSLNQGRFPVIHVKESEL